MNVFKQNRYLWITITVLVVINLVTLSLLWMGRPVGPKQGHGPLPPNQDRQRIRQLLQEQLSFTDEQIERYLALRQEHRQETRRLDAEIRELKRKMFDRVLEEQAPPAISDSLLNLVLAKQAELEKVTFQHFLDLKNLCGPEQREKLKLLMHEALRPEAPPRMPEGKGPSPPHRPEMPPPPLED
ncbi:MAG: hypothetical protein Kow0042_23920 [Calditrichia bacterium]